ADVYPVASSADLAGLVFAARRMSSLRLSLRTRTWLFLAFHLRYQLRGRSLSRPDHLFVAGFLFPPADLAGPDFNDYSHPHFQPLVCPLFQGGVSGVRPLF